MGWNGENPIFGGEGNLLIISAAGKGKDKKGDSRKMRWFCFINNGLNV